MKFLFLLLAAALPAVAQTNAPATNAPSTNAPAAIAPVSVGDVVTQAQAATAQLQQGRSDLATDAVLQAAQEKLPKITVQIDARLAQEKRLLDGSAGLSTLQPAQAAWQGIADDLKSMQRTLSDRVTDLNKQLWAQLTPLQAKWQATSDAARAAKAPPEIVQHADQVVALAKESIGLVQANLNALYKMQSSVAGQSARALAQLDGIGKAMEEARTQMFEQDHPPLWSGKSLAQPRGGIVAQERVSLGAQVDAAQDYLADKVGAVIVQLILFLVLAMGFHWLKNMLAAKQPELRHAAQVFAVPLATALLVTLIGSDLIYSDAPALFLAMVGAIALVPAVIIIRRLIEPALFPLFYATVVAYAYDQLRLVIRPGGVLSRAMLIVELLAVCVFLILALRSRRFAAAKTLATNFEHMLHAYLHGAFLVFIVAGFANVFGYIHLSVFIANGMLQSSYLAVILYAIVRIFDALAISALNVRPLSALRLVRNHHELIYANTARYIRWGVIVAWLLIALQFFSLREPMWDLAGQFLQTKLPWGKPDPKTVGDLIAFPLTIWAAFLLSRFVRFCLEEEVYSHFHLGRGVPYAASTMVHYAILLVGFFAALNVLGIDLSQYAILAGAFGVGLGFGLQNIMNNFMSGLILLFEQPVKVGDMIQIDANTMGRVERIGIRASVILLTNGSELIVPNGSLISSPVTNWTLSNCERLIEIPVTVTSKSDPQHIVDLLIKIAAADSRVLKNPPPQALLTAFGASLAFKLRAWIDSEEEWMKITSELSLAVNAALAKEGITLG